MPVQRIELRADVAANAIVAYQLIDALLQYGFSGFSRVKTAPVGAGIRIKNAVGLHIRKDRADRATPIPITQTLKVASPVRRNRRRIAEKVRIHRFEKRQVQAVGQSCRLSHTTRIPKLFSIPVSAGPGSRDTVHRAKHGDARDKANELTGGIDRQG